MIAAKPRPCTNRSTISHSMGSGIMNVTDAAAATTRPPIIIAFAPTRSARIPAGHWPMACDQRRSDDHPYQPIRRAALTKIERKDRQQRSDARAGDEDAGDDSKRAERLSDERIPAKPKLS